MERKDGTEIGIQEVEGQKKRQVLVLETYIETAHH